VVRDESRVVIESHVPLSSKTVEYGEQAGVLGVDPPANEFDDRNVMARLAPGPEAVAEHKSQRSSEHGFIRLLKACLVIKREDFVGRVQLPFGAGEEALDLRPVNVVRLELFHAAPSAKRVYCARRSPRMHPSARGEIRIHLAIELYN